MRQLRTLAGVAGSLNLANDTRARCRCCVGCSLHAQTRAIFICVLSSLSVPAYRRRVEEAAAKARAEAARIKEEQRRYQEVRFLTAPWAAMQQSLGFCCKWD